MEEMMRYLGYVEAGNDTHATSVVLPDFPGCFSAVDNEQDLNTAVQEAVELHFEGEDFDLPTPLTLSKAQDLSDFDYLGAWMWFEIDTDKISTKLQRVNITIPTNILTKLDALAGNQHTSRSGMVRQLVEKF
jgi:predicted RNase H-like HicB family nuclease